jgi:hypothetical protein
MCQVEVFWVVTLFSVVVKMEAALTSETSISCHNTDGVTTHKSEDGGSMDL